MCGVPEIHGMCHTVYCKATAALLIMASFESPAVATCTIEPPLISVSLQMHALDAQRLAGSRDLHINDVALQLQTVHAHALDNVQTPSILPM